MFTQKMFTTLELDTRSATDFSKYITETRAGFLQELIINELPTEGIVIKADENGMIEISTNSGYSIFKNKYRRQIKKNMTKEKLYDIIHDYKEALVIKAFQGHSSSKERLNYFMLQAKYSWLFPEIIGITVENRNKCIEVAKNVHEMFIKYLQDIFDYYYPVQSICYSTMEELPEMLINAYEELKDDEEWFMGIQEDNIPYVWPEDEILSPNPYPAGTVTKNNDGQYPSCLLWTKSPKNFNLDEYDRSLLDGDEGVQNEVIKMRKYGLYAQLRDFFDGQKKIWYGGWRDGSPVPDIPKSTVTLKCEITTCLYGKEDISIPGYGIIKNFRSKLETTETVKTEDIPVTKWEDHSSEEDTDFSPQDELHFDEYGEIVDIEYTQNELRRLREEPWYDQKNKYYYMKTPDGQKFKEGSPYYLLGQLWREHIKTKAIRRTEAKKNTPKKKNIKNTPMAPKKIWNKISHKSRDDLSPIHFPAL